MPTDQLSDPDSYQYRTRHNWDDGKDVSTSVIEAVASMMDFEPTNLDPFFDSIDPDALDQLVLSMRGGTDSDLLGKISFTFNDNWVTVWSDGTIAVEPIGKA